jgi:hypothetical protein
LGQRLQRLLALSSSTLQQQQQQWGVPASRQFQMLLRCVVYSCSSAVMLTAWHHALVYAIVPQLFYAVGLPLSQPSAVVMADGGI